MSSLSHRGSRNALIHSESDSKTDSKTYHSSAAAAASTGSNVSNHQRRHHGGGDTAAVVEMGTFPEVLEPSNCQSQSETSPTSFVITPAARDRMLAAFDAFDVGTAAGDYVADGRLNAHKLYALCNAELDEGQYIDLVLFDQCFDRIDTEKQLCLSRAQFQNLIDTVQRLQNKSMLEYGHALDMKLWSFCCFMFFPFFMVFASPWRKLDSSIRHVFLAGMRHYALPFKMRRFVSYNRCGFLLWYLVHVIAFVGMWGAFIIGTWLLWHRDYEIRMSGMEFSVTPVLLLMNNIIVAFAINVDDRDNVKQQRRMTHDYSMRDVPVKCERTPKRSTVNSAMQMLAYVLHESPQELDHMVKRRKYINMFSVFTAVVFAAIPFLVRLVEGVVLLGDCRSVSYIHADACTTNENRIFRWIVIQSACFNAWYVYWSVSTLFDTYFTFRDRSRYSARMRQMLVEADEMAHPSSDARAALESKSCPMPHIKFDHPENVVSWGMVRDYMYNFKHGAHELAEVVTASASIPLVVMLTLIVILRVRGFDSPIDRGIIFAYSAYLMGVMGIFLLYPLLSMGLATNANIEAYTEFLSVESWRLAVSAEMIELARDRLFVECERARLRDNLTRVDELQQQIAQQASKAESAKQAHKLVLQQHKFLQDNDTSFKVFGVSINTTLVVSITMSVFGSLAMSLSAIIFQTEA
jgi:hypothetical protein